MMIFLAFSHGQDVLEDEPVDEVDGRWLSHGALVIVEVLGVVEHRSVEVEFVLLKFHSFLGSRQSIYQVFLFVKDTNNCILRSPDVDMSLIGLAELMKKLHLHVEAVAIHLMLARTIQMAASTAIPELSVIPWDTDFDRADLVKLHYELSIAVIFGLNLHRFVFNVYLAILGILSFEISNIDGALVAGDILQAWWAIPMPRPAQVPETRMMLRDRDWLCRSYGSIGSGSTQ